MAAVLDELNDLFRQVFEDPEIVVSAETTADDVDGWDSLSHITLISAVEAHFQIEFSRREVARLKNVGDLLNAIESKLGG